MNIGKHLLREQGTDLKVPHSLEHSARTQLLPMQNSTPHLHTTGTRWSIKRCWRDRRMVHLHQVHNNQTMYRMKSLNNTTMAENHVQFLNSSYRISTMEVIVLAGRKINGYRLQFEPKKIEEAQTNPRKGQQQEMQVKGAAH